MFGVWAGTIGGVNDPAEWVGPAIAGLTLLTLLGVLLRGVWRFVRKASHFLDDVSGQEARPGRPAVPGLVQQVADLRVRQEQIAQIAVQAATDAAETAELVRHELTRNGGGSTKDKVHQTLRASERNGVMLEQLGAEPPPLPLLSEDGEHANE